MSAEFGDWVFDAGVWTKISAWRACSESNRKPDWCIDELENADVLDEGDDDEGPLWIIDVLPNGTFSVFRSHHFLTNRDAPFQSLLEAVRYCDSVDSELQYGRHEPPPHTQRAGEDPLVADREHSEQEVESYERPKLPPGLLFD